ncbi:hypothetical protein I8752_29195 [Nostocaceae cyanobacterium CENA369]|uniref:Uncharacterized protein n=1 Tax=Dendronalium phyllosphericum CENA369 TaxID=1725256 RepID=A0A8J7LH43_9NOST|nr:hypothetical protein [Dendronalium phyllosphericum]MBH8576986.1 hypothetical protein [Dendronalium phyllosphericum CENA369]
MANLKSYLLTIDNINYALHLDSNVYEGIKDMVGLTDMPTPAPASLRQTSITELERNGLAHKISVGLATTASGKITKRKVVMCPSTKPFKNMIGKQINSLYVKSASVKTHRNFV